MRTFIEPIKYTLYDVGINIKCKLEIYDKIYIFNCQTKYADAAETEIERLLYITMISNKCFECVLKEQGKKIYIEVCESWNY